MSDQHGRKRSFISSIIIERYLPAIIKMQKTIVVLFWLTFISLSLILTTLYIIKKQPLPVMNISQSSQLVDRNGILIDHFNIGNHRHSVSLEYISDYVKQATLAIEDKRFYSHFGIDIKGLARAIVVNIQSNSSRQGASTITQQLARNLYLSHEKTIERKAKEAYHTLQLELHYSKDEILNLYLNQIYFGHGVYGIEAAAQYFFNKPASDLTLAESALLVGIPKGPTYYSPFNNMKNAKNRQKLILQAMVNEGFITEAEKDAAFSQILNFSDHEKSNTETNAGYFKDYVISEAINSLNIDEQLLFNGGVTIYTTLDIHMQELAEQLVNEDLAIKPELQAALIAIDPRNGHIKAMVGGRDYKESQFNRVLSTMRQPGSTFKPIVYLTALKQKTVTPVTTYISEPTTFTYDNNKTYEPHNYSKRYANSPITLRQAIATSDNIYAVHTILDTGIDKVIEQAKALGITSPLERVPSLALGTSPVSPLELTSAYGVLANKGEYHKPISILKIVNKEGKTIYEANYDGQAVVNEAEAYVLTSLLQEVFAQGGTANRVSHLINRPVAGKSGTTAVDAWMVGYTPELSTAVWVGYDKDVLLSISEAHLAAPLFAKFMNQALLDVPPKMFSIPNNVATVFIDPETKLLASVSCPGYYVEHFISGTEPTAYCDPFATEVQEESIPVQEQQEKQQKHWWDYLRKWIYE